MLILKIKYKTFKEITKNNNSNYSIIPIQDKLKGKLPQQAFIYLLSCERLVLYKDGKRKYVSQKPMVDDGSKYVELSGCIVAKCDVVDMIQTNDTETPYNYVIQNIVVSKQPTKVSLPKSTHRDYSYVKKLLTREQKR